MIAALGCVRDQGREPARGAAHRVTRRRMTLVAVVLVLLAGAVWGCGSDHPSKRTARAPESAQRGGGERGESEEGEREALRRLPAPDRLAYFRLATAAGVLSEDASVQIASRKTPARRRERLAKLRQQV